VLDALRDGYECYAVVDAVGGTSRESHHAGLRRIEQAGARPISWTSLMCEMQRDWARRETAEPFAKVLFTVEGH
jgi:nicotinamidase-related amidase